ncbi:6350_t:CDS:2, partial [Entrophospora sp. SA101]
GYNEDHLKHRFFHGLSPDNQIEARICGLDLSLDELVGRLSAIENIRKNQSDMAQTYCVKCHAKTNSVSERLETTES